MRIYRLYSVYLLLLFTLLLNGCAARNIALEYSLDEAKGTGIMVVSLTRSGLQDFNMFNRKFNMFADLRGIDNDYKSAVAVTDLFASSDWKCPFLGEIPDDQPCGRLAIVELPQGEYEFYSWHGGTAKTHAWAQKEFSKRFKITAGKAVYIGNIHFSVTKGFLFYMKVIDMQERDLALFYSKNPNITPDKIIIDILK